MKRILSIYEKRLYARVEMLLTDNLKLRMRHEFMLYGDSWRMRVARFLICQDERKRAKAPATAPSPLDGPAAGSA